MLVEALCCVPWEQVPEEIAGVVPEHLLLADLVPTEGQGPPSKIIRSWIRVG